MADLLIVLLLAAFLLLCLGLGKFLAEVTK
jgi:hypothetical protein